MLRHRLGLSGAEAPTMSPSQEFAAEAAAMRIAAANATQREEREEYERLAVAYEALARSPGPRALVAAGWLSALAA